MGDNCEIAPACDAEPCLNGGVCSENGETPSVAGYQCQDPASCSDEQCNAAVCAIDPVCCDNWDGLCANCAAGQPGFGGLDCTAAGPECEIPGETGYECTCVDGYTGVNCEIQIP